MQAGKKEHLIVITDLLGRVIEKTTLVSNSRQTSWTWDGRDQNGKMSTTGIYFVSISDGGQPQTRKITLLK